jgi:signal transduction histidine kinase
VLLNLLINAREAIDSSGGDVRVSVRERRGQAEIRINDTGLGIPSRDATRVFEPFFTTKKMGTGLGLPISRTIVENLGGTLTLQSTAGRGTEATVILPVGRTSAGLPLLERTQV